MNASRVQRCLLCGDTGIDAEADGRFVTTTCRVCAAALMIEFDPPDQPTLRARIERIDEPDDRGSSRVKVPEVITSRDESVASGLELSTRATLEVVPSF